MSLLLGGPELIKFLAALAIFHQDDLMKKMNKITFTGRNGCFYKMDDQPVHTTPNHHAPKVVVLPKTFLQIILDAKWLLRHSSTSHQPPATTLTFPSLLSSSTRQRHICNAVVQVAEELNSCAVMLVLGSSLLVGATPLAIHSAYLHLKK